jgi:3-hydroxyacyl-CoA dehydrogenase, NAD binding domain
VVEAIVEDPQAKGKMFAMTQHRERVLGLHFFSPVPVMKLVEVVVALETADDAVARGRLQGPRRLRRQHAVDPVPDGRGAHVRGRLRDSRGGSTPTTERDFPAARSS